MYRFRFSKQATLVRGEVLLDTRCASFETQRFALLLRMREVCLCHE
jgi:hypothetical protein